MKCKLLILFMIVSSFVFAAEKFNSQVNNNINYYNIEVIQHLTNVGLGTRNIFDHHGYDFNVSFDPIYMAKNKFQLSTFQGNLNYLYSFSKDANNFYSGLGINSYAEVDGSIKIKNVNPCILLGAHFPLLARNNFIELKGNWSSISLPFDQSNYKFTDEFKRIFFDTPNISLRFGIGF